MKFKDYIQHVRRTEATANADMITRFEHGVIGIATEAGELMDILKRRKFYGKALDRTHILEEIGDIAFYLAMVCDACEIDLVEALEKNVAKLKARYPERFTEENALNRDLDAERKALK